LTLDSSGNLFGVTSTGGTFDFGTVFKLTASTDWSESILYNFGQSSTDSEYPNGGLVFDPAGNFYGTTEEGGIYLNGTIFKLTP
jgi:uncharacterized repeat protein (TIGR03803 family)